MLEQETTKCNELYPHYTSDSIQRSETSRYLPTFVGHTCILHEIEIYVHCHIPHSSMKDVPLDAVHRIPNDLASCAHPSSAPDIEFSESCRTCYQPLTEFEIWERSPRSKQKAMKRLK